MNNVTRSRFEAQVKADQAHHEKRVKWLESKKSLTHFESSLLKQSRNYQRSTHFNSCNCDPKCSTGI